MLTKEELQETLGILSIKADEENGWWNSEWTRRIKYALRDLAKKKDKTIKVYGSDLGDDCYSEWLWDLVWAKWEANKNERAPDYLDSLLLVVESEWGKYRDVIEDFEKLLVARADVRVIIYDDVGGDKGDLFDEFKDRISHYKGKVTGDRYLFAFYESKDPDSKTKFKIEEYIVP